MSWAKLCDTAAFHPKVVAAGNDAVGAWVRAIAWSSAHLTEGRIPWSIALTIAPKKVWMRLLQVKLCDRVDDEFFQIHDFLQYNPKGDTVRAERARKAKNVADHRARQRAAATDEVTAPVTGYSTGELPPSNHGPIPIPIPIPIPSPAGVAPPAPMAPAGPLHQGAAREKTDERHALERLIDFCPMLRPFDAARLAGHVVQLRVLAANTGKPLWLIVDAVAGYNNALALAASCGEKLADTDRGIVMEELARRVNASSEMKVRDGAGPDTEILFVAVQRAQSEAVEQVAREVETLAKLCGSETLVPRFRAQSVGAAPANGSGSLDASQPRPAMTLAPSTPTTAAFAASATGSATESSAPPSAPSARFREAKLDAKLEPAKPVRPRGWHEQIRKAARKSLKWVAERAGVVPTTAKMFELNPEKIASIRKRMALARVYEELADALAAGNAPALESERRIA